MLRARGRVFSRYALTEPVGFTRILRSGSAALAAVRPGLRPRLPAGERQSEDGAVHHVPLLRKPSGVVGQLVTLADVFDLRRDLGVSTARHVGVKVVLHLITQVAADHVEQRAALDVRGAEQLNWHSPLLSPAH